MGGGGRRVLELPFSPLAFASKRARRRFFFCAPAGGGGALRAGVTPAGGGGAFLMGTGLWSGSVTARDSVVGVAAKEASVSWFLPGPLFATGGGGGGALCE